MKPALTFPPQTRLYSRVAPSKEHIIIVEEQIIPEKVPDFGNSTLKKEDVVATTWQLS
jgi:hypothetical protein